MTARPTKRGAIKARPKIKPKRQLSEAELAQRRAASVRGALAATGPRTPEGKAAVSRNGWKHGRYSAIHRSEFGLGAASLSKLFGKPCLTTCPMHPDNPDRTESPCSLVVDGLTHAGGDCLDKRVYVNAFSHIIDALESGEMAGMHGLMASNMASNLELLHAMRSEVAERGIVMFVPAISKEGEVILDPISGKPAPAKIQLNPALSAIIAMTETLKLNLPELMVTPKARRDARSDDDKTDAVQQLLGGMFQRANAGMRARITDGNSDG